MSTDSALPDLPGEPCHGRSTTDFSTAIVVRRVFQLLILLLSWPVTLGCFKLTENSQPVVFCQSSVPQLPLTTNDLPSKVAKLRIVGSSGFHSGTLMPYNMTGLETLTYLEISSFNLKLVETGTFASMPHLRVLDLSKNDILTIQPGAFRGLNLDLLSLTANAGIKLSTGSLHGSRIFHFAARSCDLNELSFDMFSDARPKQFSLSDNQITHLDARFGDLLYPESSDSSWGYIDLSNNPLICDCRLLWFSKLIEQQLYDQDQTKTPSSSDGQVRDQRVMHALNMTCAQPGTFSNRPIPRSWQLYCPVPKIVGINIDLVNRQTGQAQLTCVGQGNPAPTLAWTYAMHGQKVQRILDPSTHNQQGGSFYQSTALRMPRTLLKRQFSINVTLLEQIANNFTCTVWNDDSIDSNKFSGTAEAYSRSAALLDQYKSSTNNEITPNPLAVYRWQEVVVKVRDRNRLTAVVTNTTIESDLEAIQSKPNLLDSVDEEQDYDYLFTKRYTLLELLGAIMGTFMITLILLLVIRRFVALTCSRSIPVSCLSYHRKRAKPGWFNLDNNKSITQLVPQLPTSNLPLPSRFRDSLVGGRKSLTNTVDSSSILPSLSAAYQKDSMRANSSLAPTLPSSRTLVKPIPQLASSSTTTSDRIPTPPPNPVYWPEYTYTSGSNEYDVPRPLDPTNGQTMPGMMMPVVNFLTLNKYQQQQQLNTLGNNRFASPNWAPLPSIPPTYASSQYHQTAPPINPCTDYPTYLAARPYPHHVYPTTYYPQMLNAGPNFTNAVKSSELAVVKGNALTEVDQQDSSDRPSYANTLSNQTNSTNGGSV